jgi:hypothetical protein
MRGALRCTLGTSARPGRPSMIPPVPRPAPLRRAPEIAPLVRRAVLSCATACTALACSLIVSPDTSRLSAPDGSAGNGDLEGAPREGGRHDGGSHDAAPVDARSACEGGGDACTGLPCADDAECDDGTLCNGIERCVGGSCAPGMRIACDDGRSCTEDACVETVGCVFSPRHDRCDDRRWCSGEELCAPDRGDARTGCAAGTPRPECDDGMTCTVDDCAGPGACAHTPDDGLCSDAIVCTIDRCDRSDGDGCSHAPSDRCTATGCSFHAADRAYDCPAAWSYSTSGGAHVCTSPAFVPPPTVTEYCHFAEAGYVGFTFHDAAAFDYECPPGSYYQFDKASAFCIWSGIEYPPHASIDCDVEAGRISYRWPC